MDATGRPIARRRSDPWKLKVRVNHPAGRISALKVPGHCSNTEQPAHSCLGLGGVCGGCSHNRVPQLSVRGGPANGVAGPGCAPASPRAAPLLTSIPVPTLQLDSDLQISPHSPLVSTALQENGWVCGKWAGVAGSVALGYAGDLCRAISRQLHAFATQLLAIHFMQVKTNMASWGWGGAGWCNCHSPSGPSPGKSLA